MAELMFTGDLLCYPAMAEATGGDYGIMFSRIQEHLCRCDLLVGNLETPVAGEKMVYTHERYCFNSPAAFTQAMADKGFHLVTLANNHCADRGEEGIRLTLDNCRNCGLDTVGIYRSAEERGHVYVREIGGIRVAILNYTYGINTQVHGCILKNRDMVNLLQPEELTYGSIHLLQTGQEISEQVQKIYYGHGPEYQVVQPYLQRLRRDIEAAKAQADYVIMALHCGGQYNMEVDAYTRFIVERIWEYGADLIVGNHPHIIQPCERRGEKLTVYSLGNFLFSLNHGESKSIDPSYHALLHVHLDRNDAGKIEMKAAFQLCRVVEENGVTYSSDTYDLYAGTPHEAEVLYYANRFANTDRFDRVQRLYPL